MTTPTTSTPPRDLNRAVSEIFYEFGLVEQAKVQMGMTNNPWPMPATFTEKIGKVLLEFSVPLNGQIESRILEIEELLKERKKEEILPKEKGGAYGREFMKLLQAAQ